MEVGSGATASSWAAAIVALSLMASASSASDGVKRVLVLYPVSDGQPGILRFDESLRSELKARPNIRVEIYNEFLDSARFPGERHRRRLAEFLREKYADRKPDVIIPALAPSLDFVLAYRDELFPGVPVVYGAIDRREVEARKLARDVVGVPMRVNIELTLDLMLRLHAGTRRVFVVAGRSKSDAYWVGEARKVFRDDERNVEFVYLAGLPMDDLLRRVAALPDRSVIYYLHLFEDGLGATFVPADVVGPLSAAANAPVYGHFDTYVGRGIVGGRVVSFEAEGVNAAKVASYILAGETPEGHAIARAEGNPSLFDWHELTRWGIDEGSLPSGSVILNRPPSFWALYKWRIIGGAVLCIAEALLIVVLLIERANRRRTEAVLRSSRRELRALTGRLIRAQETERRRIARELHDDLNQRLALLAIELDLIARGQPGPDAPHDGRLREVSNWTRQLSSAVHDLSHQLHPIKLEHLGLVPALRSLCSEMGRAHRLDIGLAASAEMPSIPDDIALCIYRIAQEALRNVIKHGGACQVRVEMGSGQDAYWLRITDDGIGFDPGSAAARGGLGLVSMRERSRMIGGGMTIDSRPAGGSRIEIRIPRAASEQDLRADETHG